MPSTKLCVFGCETTSVTIHDFPNPSKDPERFRSWVDLAGEYLNGVSHKEIYRKKKVCDKHFTQEDKNRNRRLNALSIPSLNLPIHQARVQNDHNYCKESIIFTSKSSEDAQQANLVESDAEFCVHTHIAVHHARLQNDHNYCKENIIFTSNSSEDAQQATSVESDAEFCAKKHTKLISKKTHITDCNLKGSKNPKTAVNLNLYKNLQREIKTLKHEVLRLKKRGANFKTRLASATKMSSTIALETITKQMTLPAKIFTNMQFRETHKKAKGHRFTNDEKILSLSLYKRSPKCYKLLSKCFTLPTAKSLKNLLAKIKIFPGINKVIFEKLKVTVQEMNEENRLCTLIFDEMSISPQVHYNASRDEIKGFSSIDTKKIADHALVFMIRGIRQHYKQPVAYYFTQSLNKVDLKKVLKDVIHQVQVTGLKIIATVCDQSTVNVGAIDELIAEAKALFRQKGLAWRNNMIIIGNQKIIPLFDIPHIIKGIRNNLITKDLKYIDIHDNNNEKIIKWEYYQNIYEADQLYGELRILHKISEEHVNAKKVNKMRVKSATQLFSRSVAIAAKHLVDGGKLDIEYLKICPFNLFIDKLFDSLNCNSFFPINGKIYRAGVRYNSPHHKLWEEGIKFLESIKFIEKKMVNAKIRLIEKTVPSLKNFVKTIEGMQVIWKMLHKNYGYDVLLLRNFNQDPIENFFGNIRSLGVRNVNPNAVAFEGAFKALLMNNFSSTHSIKGNCEDDGSNFLQTFDFFLTFGKETDDNKKNVIIINEELLETPDQVNCATEGVDTKTYVCGWVLRKCLKNIIKTCKTCRKNLITAESTSIHSLLIAKEYSNKKWLCYPSVSLIELFNAIQQNVVNVLKLNNQFNNTRQTVKVLNEILINFKIFDCIKHKNCLKEYFENISINIFICSWCRSINRILSGKLTYTGNDFIKTSAQLYFEKHKHYKNKK